MLKTDGRCYRVIALKTADKRWKFKKKKLKFDKSRSIIRQFEILRGYKQNAPLQFYNWDLKTRNDRNSQRVEFWKE